MTAEQFEAAWRRGQRRFHDVSRVEVEPGRRGNTLRLARVAELQAEQWQLALIRDRVLTINARALPPPPARQLDAI